MSDLLKPFGVLVYVTIVIGLTVVLVNALRR